MSLGPPSLHLSVLSLRRLCGLRLSLGRQNVARQLPGHNLPAWHHSRNNFPSPVVLATVLGLGLRSLGHILLLRQSRWDRVL